VPSSSLKPWPQKLSSRKSMSVPVSVAMLMFCAIE